MPDHSNVPFVGDTLALESAAGPNRADILSVDGVLASELAHLRPDPAERGDPAFTALCLSGGGIRSAAFCLGVLQALASSKLLTRFDYLSTVSGGGFIGGWLQMLIQAKGSVTQAEDTLRRRDAPEVVNLRSYTNYLTPQVGLFSTDTWTAIVLYVRNLLLNWMVILPALLGIVLILVMHRTAVAAFGRMEVPVLPWSALIIASLLLFTGAYFACLLLPSHRPEATSGSSRAYASEKSIRRSIVYPSLAWALIIPVALRGLLPDQMLWRENLAIPFSYATAMLAAYGCAWIRQRRVAAAARLFLVNIGAWITATLLATTALWIAQQGYSRLAPEDAAEALTAFAPPVLILCHLIQTVIYVGLRRECNFADLDREWLARVDGVVIRATIGWTAFAVCCLDLSWLIIHYHNPKGGTTWAIALATFLTGPAAAWIGKQAITRIEPGLDAGKWSKLPLRRLLDLLSAVFAISLFALFGALLQSLLGLAQIKLRIGGDPAAAQMAPLVQLLMLQVAFAAALWSLSWVFSRVNVNRFSMHGVYRNRLSRAFLGSALADRDADPFTGFGPRENPPMAEFTRPADAKGSRCLFPVINIALNMTHTTHTAWAERKAASFTATPLACGSAALPNPNGPASVGAYVETTNFAGAASLFDKKGASKGVRLGTLLTVSGAAVSPNWGYNSSPLAAFLMTLFNVRLGAWLPNPAVASAEDLRLARPRNSRAALFNELLGSTTDERQSIYLSDGGHFDNLGLYEMLRRRCARVVVIDAGQDAGCTFFDLGNAIRKAEIDGLATVTMRRVRIMPRTTIEKRRRAANQALGLALGDISYPKSKTYPNGGTGQLLYVKPSFLPSIPAEIRAYGAAHPEFPHENTVEQWFTESQFESYRALGNFQMNLLASEIRQDADKPLVDLFTQAEVMINASPSQSECCGERNEDANCVEFL